MCLPSQLPITFFSVFIFAEYMLLLFFATARRPRRGVLFWLSVYTAKAGQKKTSLSVQPTVSVQSTAPPLAVPLDPPGTPLKPPLRPPPLWPPQASKVVSEHRVASGSGGRTRCAMFLSCCLACVFRLHWITCVSRRLLCVGRMHQLRLKRSVS